MLNKLECLRKEYPAGTVIELIFMDDKQAPPPNTKGIVQFVDDACQIHVNWDNGSTLALVPEVDKFKKGGVMMVTFHSDYYEREISLDIELQEALFNIYIKVAEDQGFSPEVERADEIDNGDTFDHVAYHIESFGNSFPEYDDVKHLFEEEE